MQLKSTEQSDFDKVQDMVYARLETGNVGQARTIMAELRDSHPVNYSLLRTSVIREYGVSL